MIKKKGQEEMVGFALIIIIVAVILLVLLVIAIRSPQKEDVESYEVESFLRASMEYTSDCGDTLGFFSVKRLIQKCGNNELCEDKRTTCKALETTMKDIVDVSWKLGSSPLKGYIMNLSSRDKEILFIEEGEISSNSKGSLYISGNEEVKLIVYY